MQLLATRQRHKQKVKKKNRSTARETKIICVVTLLNSEGPRTFPLLVCDVLGEGSYGLSELLDVLLSRV